MCSSVVKKKSNQILIIKIINKKNTLKISFHTWWQFKCTKHYIYSLDKQHIIYTILWMNAVNFFVTGPISPGRTHKLPDVPTHTGPYKGYVPTQIYYRDLYTIASSFPWVAKQRPALFRANGQPRETTEPLGVVPQSDLSSTIIISRCYNDLNFFLRLAACSTKRSYRTVIIG